MRKSHCASGWQIKEKGFPLLQILYLGRCPTIFGLTFLMRYRLHPLTTKKNATYEIYIYRYTYSNSKKDRKGSMYHHFSRILPTFIVLVLGLTVLCFFQFVHRHCRMQLRSRTRPNERRRSKRNAAWKRTLSWFITDRVWQTIKRSTYDRWHTI